MNKFDATIKLLKSFVTSNEKYNGKVFLAGGAVRDIVMGASPKDIDVTVELQNGGIEFAEDLSHHLNIFRDTNPVTFPRFGTAKVSLDGVIFENVDLTGVDVECVQTRGEVYTPGSRKPEVSFGTKEQDVFRRDLTINSLLFDLSAPRGQEILDLTGTGVYDIFNKLIRTPSEPKSILTDDPLRILRTVRFAARYQFNIDKDLSSAIFSTRSQLEKISSERKREELEKCFKHGNPYLALRMLEEYRLFKYMFPGIIESAGAFSIYYEEELCLLGVIAHACISNSVPIKLVENEMRKMKFSSDDIKKVVTILVADGLISEFHQKNGWTREAIARKAAAAVKKNGAWSLINVLFLKHPDLKEHAKSKHFGMIPPIFFDGDDLQKRFNLGPGPLIKAALIIQSDAWFKNPDITKEQVELILESSI